MEYASTLPDEQLSDAKLPNGLTHAHMACLTRDLSFLNRLLGIPDCVEHITQKCSAIHVDELALLDPVEGKPQMPAMNGDPALHYALFTGWTDGAVTLINRLKLDNKLEPTINNTDNSSLNLAAGSCGLEVVKLLCDSLGDDATSGLINRQTSPGGSAPLHHNVKTGKPDVCVWLLKNGAEKSISLKDTGGCTPVDHLRQRLEKMEQSLEKLNQLSERSDADNLKMERLKKEFDEWKKLLPKLDPQSQEAEAGLASDMKSLKV